MRSFQNFSKNRVMSDFKERLFEELDELQDRINELDTFIKGEKFRDLEIEQQDLLKEQFRIMNQYENILSLRIELLKE